MKKFITYIIIAVCMVVSFSSCTVTSPENVGYVETRYIVVNGGRPAPYIPPVVYYGHSYYRPPVYVTPPVPNYHKPPRKPVGVQPRNTHKPTSSKQNNRNGRR